MKEELRALVQLAWREHRGKLVGTILGLVLGISVLLFGFWKTVFVLLCGLIGLFVGSRVDRGEDFLQNIRDYLQDRPHRWR